MKVNGNKIMKAIAASDVLKRIGVPVDADFHTLSGSQVDGLVNEAVRARYSKPADANGSRARYFCAKLQRMARLLKVEVTK